jgi:penicillin-insensitive murein endopeptidase
MLRQNRRPSWAVVALAAGLALPGPAAARTLVAESWGNHLAALDLGHPAKAPRATLASRSRAPRASLAPRGVRRSRRGFVQLAASRGLAVRDHDRSWGTALTVSRLRELGDDYAMHFAAAAPLQIHDLSHARGGRMTPHVSHRNGRDVDIRIPLKRETNAYVSATPKTLDIDRTWFLVKRLADTCDVEFIFLDRRLQRALFLHARQQGTPRAELAALLQYPSRKAVGVVRHSKGHANHVHVRFRHPRAQELQQAGREYCKQREQTFDPPALTLAPAATLPPA